VALLRFGGRYALSKQAQACEEEMRQRKPQADFCSGLGEDITRMITHRVTETKPTLSSIGLQRDSGSRDSLSHV
jgi:hypothetical protein